MRHMREALASDEALGLLDGLPPGALSDPELRRSWAWLTLKVRCGLGGPSLEPFTQAEENRLTRLHRESHADWIMSRASGVALVVGSLADLITDEGRWDAALGEFVESQRCYIENQQRENEQRDAMTPAVCRMVADAIDDTAYTIMRRQAERLGYSGRTITHLTMAEAFMGYTFIRNFLVWECGAEYRLACITAFRMAVSHNRRLRRIQRDDSGAERGWL